MTNQQTGREAFEAWYAENDNTRKSIERDATGYRLIQTEAAWQAWDAAWQAALAQQGREVGDPVAWLCKAEARVPPAFVESEAVARDTYERVGYNITPLYTATPKQQAVEVTEGMVERAWKAATLACVVKGRYRAPVAPNEWFAALRAALLAALAGKTEVDRG